VLEILSDTPTTLGDFCRFDAVWNFPWFWGRYSRFIYVEYCEVDGMFLCGTKRCRGFGGGVGEGEKEEEKEEIRGERHHEKTAVMDECCRGRAAKKSRKIQSGLFPDFFHQKYPRPSSCLLTH